MDFDVAAFAYNASTWVLPVLIAITFHEAAHGFVAWRLGDDTAYRRGRVTFNPLRHVDPFGTILVPAVLFFASGGRFLLGWAKPVPVAFGRLRAPRRDMVLVAAAGPGINLALALACALLFNLVGWFPASFAAWLSENLWNAVLINLILAVFNMLPLPPLDGGRVAVGLLPDALARPLARLERYGLLILIALLFLLPMLGDELGFDLNFLHYVIWIPVQWMIPLFAQLAGLA